MKKLNHTRSSLKRRLRHSAGKYLLSKVDCTMAAHAPRAGSAIRRFAKKVFAADLTPKTRAILIKIVVHSNIATKSTVGHMSRCARS